MSHLKIAIKHHSNYILDPIENGITEDSGIIYPQGNKHSYYYGFSSKCVVTYGSTIGYELLAHDIPTLFLDPAGKCSLLPKSIDQGGDYLPSMNRAKNYNEFKNFVSSLDKKKLFDIIDKDFFCCNSKSVSNSIYNYLCSKL